MKLEETGRKGKKQKNWKKKNTENRKKLNDTERNGQKQKETERNRRKQ